MRETSSETLNDGFLSFKRLYETDAEKITRLEYENKKLGIELAQERIMRKDAEDRVSMLEKENYELKTAPPKRKRRTKAEMIAAGVEYTEYKSDGKRKSRPADPIRSYEDFSAIQNYFLSQGKIRDYALWTIGVSLGLRISDLLSLKIKSILNEDKTFRKRIFVIEQKTSKLNNCLITESVIQAATKYFDSIEWDFDLDDFLFKSYKTKGKMYEEYGWKILSDAGKALNLPIVIGSHTMRKSFANIAACVYHFIKSFIPSMQIFRPFYARSIQKNILFAATVANRDKQAGILGRQFFEKRRAYNRQIFMQHIIQRIRNIINQTTYHRGIFAPRHLAINILQFFTIIGNILKHNFRRMAQNQQIYSLGEWFHRDFYISVHRQINVKIFINIQPARENIHIIIGACLTQSERRIITAFGIIFATTVGNKIS